ncbi:MAG TPA: substrate-binding domain-containing protein [Pyrinomonadaceae bacterium]|jgi:ribose transport system substrate-binding protein
MKRILILIFVLALALQAGCRGGRSASGKKFTIAVVPMGTTHEYWKSIHAGAVKAQQELTTAGTPVEIIWKGPLREDDREQQVQVVEGFVSQGVNGMVVAPLDKDALVRPVEEAARGGIPTVVVDSELNSQQIASFVATDNFKGGQIAADQMGKLLGGKGKVLMMRTSEGANSSLNREAGFLQRLHEAYPNMQLVSSEQFAGPTRDGAKRLAENLLNRYGEDLQGIFTSNESSTAGMLLALQDIAKAGKITFIGFDSNQTFIDAMQSGQLNAFVVQNPFKMGYLGVTTMVDYLQNKPVEKRIDTGVTLITPENLHAPETAELLHPPLDRYLK